MPGDRRMYYVHLARGQIQELHDVVRRRLRHRGNGRRLVAVHREKEPVIKDVQSGVELGVDVPFGAVQDEHALGAAEERHRELRAEYDVGVHFPCGARHTELVPKQLRFRRHHDLVKIRMTAKTSPPLGIGVKKVILVVTIDLEQRPHQVGRIDAYPLLYIQGAQHDRDLHDQLTNYVKRNICVPAGTPVQLAAAKSATIPARALRCDFASIHSVWAAPTGSEFRRRRKLCP